MILGPRIYKQNMKWELRPQNKIDTIVMQPIQNTIGEDPSDFHTETFTSAKIGSTTVTLPISNNTVPTYYRYMNNAYYEIPLFSTQEYAKARIECVMATGTRTFTIEQAIAGIPNVSIKLIGTSAVVDRGGGTYDSYPSYNNMANKNYSLASWIESHKSRTNDFLMWPYEDGKFSMNPWIRRVIPTDLSNIGNVTPNDIVTKWAAFGENGYQAQVTKWSDNANFTMGDQFDMMCANASYDTEDREIMTQIRMRNASLPITVSIRKKSDYQFEVTWTAPVRVAYVAASRRSFFGNHETDNYAFVDNITQVEVHLIGKPRSTDSEDISYSLDSSGNLTRESLDTYPLKIDKCENITLSTYVQSIASQYDATVKCNGELRDHDEYTYIEVYVTRNGTPVTNLAEGDTIAYNGEIGTIDENGEDGYYSLRVLYYGQFNKIQTITGHVTTYNSTKEEYTQWISYAVLARNKDGKYIVTCDVPATWALRNNVHIDTTVNIQLQDGNMIKRDGYDCIFAVKAIEKRFSASEFIYSLKLMEVRQIWRNGL